MESNRLLRGFLLLLSLMISWTTGQRTSYQNFIDHDQTFNCTIDRILQGEWYSRENNEDRVTNIDATTMTGRGTCKTWQTNHGGEYWFIFTEDPRNPEACHHCVNVFVRTVNILEKRESGCVQFSQSQVSSIKHENMIERVCGELYGLNSRGVLEGNLIESKQKVTMFSEKYSPMNCRSSIEGIFQFTYRYTFVATAVCSQPEQQIHSCQNVGSQFGISNQKFNITYKKCPGMEWTKDSVVEYSCLGDWFDGKNHFFAVANTKESRKDEKYRCFLKNRNDDYFLGQSITPECNQVKTVEQAPIRMQLTPVKQLTVEPGCLLPENFTGQWVNTARIDADVTVNSTHIVETWHPDVGRWRKEIFVCLEQRDSRYMMARLTPDGCQIDHQCFDFLPRHHNIIRFRKGVVFSNIVDFHTVCSWVQFPNDAAWKYDLMIKKDPVPVRCPIAGAFEFQQEGDQPFVTRVIKGITKNPRHDVWGRTGQFSCRKNISRLAVCDTDQKEMTIDETYCWSVDQNGRPIDIYSDVDYRMQCIGYWKENLKSYLITYDQLDAFTKYRCWVYQRADLNKMLMSMSVGPFCDLSQSVHSKDWRHGAVVSLKLDENEREFDRCPMYYNDGEDPWTVEENYIKVFDFSNLSGAPTLVLPSLITILILCFFAV